ncbi:MAG TPA: galactokinase [Pyrinomonadaceae bacterium]|nr:galactokinase [Pyrinomonadaceae bacterium]
MAPENLHNSLNPKNLPPARVFRAPGRVNLIGEHTDYNAGFVLPAAIDFSTRAELHPLKERRLEIYSEEFDEYIELNLDAEFPRPTGHWSDYVIGVAVTLENAGHRLKGARIRIRSDIPLGAGLSSSAAIEVVTAYSLVKHSRLKIDRVELAKLCQKSENEFVGARVGIMDQFASLNGRLNHALLLDCRSLDFKLFELPDSIRLVICNTMVKHELAGSEYNKRRAECEAGLKKLAEFLPGITALRDVSAVQLEEHREALPEIIYRRCRHVITENARTLAAAGALEVLNLPSFGLLMNESHRSLRDDYEVSCRELDLMVSLAHEVDGVYGARMTGGGFGGCTINLVDSDKVKSFKAYIAEGYYKATKLLPEIYVTNAANGAEEI